MEVAKTIPTGHVEVVIQFLTGRAGYSVRPLFYQDGIFVFKVTNYLEVCVIIKKFFVKIAWKLI